MNRATKGTPTAEPLFGSLTAARVLASNQRLNPDVTTSLSINAGIAGKHHLAGDRQGWRRCKLRSFLSLQRGATWETCGLGKAAKRTGSPLSRLEVSPIAGGTPGRRRLLVSPILVDRTLLLRESAHFNL